MDHECERGAHSGNSKSNDAILTWVPGVKEYVPNPDPGIIGRIAGGDNLNSVDSWGELDSNPFIGIVAVSSRGSQSSVSKGSKLNADWGLEVPCPWLLGNIQLSNGVMQGIPRSTQTNMT